MRNIFRVNEKIFPSFAEALNDACDGLIYISETDSPVVPFLAGKVEMLSAATMRQIAGKDIKEPVEELDLASFFEKLTRQREWFTKADLDRSKRFLELQALLEENLRDAKVFRLGRIRITIYAVGLGPDDHVAGVKTLAVET
jgi:hypothetical protein